MTNKYFKKFSTSLIIRGIQIKTPLKYHFPLEWISSRNPAINVGEDVKKELLFTAGWVPTSTAGMESNSEVPQRNILTIRLSYLTPETRELHPTPQIICSSMFTTALFTIARKQNQPSCSSADEWLMKICYICETEYYSILSHRKIDGPGMYSIN